MKKKSNKKEILKNNKGQFILPSPKEFKNLIDKWLEEDKRYLEFLAVFATVTALFLNISKSNNTEATEALMYLQMILLMILSISLLFYSLRILWRLTDSIDNLTIFMSFFIISMMFNLYLYSFIAESYKEQLKEFWPFVRLIGLNGIFGISLFLTKRAPNFFEKKIKNKRLLRPLRVLLIIIDLIVFIGYFYFIYKFTSQFQLKHK